MKNLNEFEKEHQEKVDEAFKKHNLEELLHESLRFVILFIDSSPYYEPKAMDLVERIKEALKTP